MTDVFVSSARWVAGAPEGSRWKVTARFDVDCGGDSPLRVVQLRLCHRSTHLVVRVSQERFERLFRPETDEDREDRRARLSLPSSWTRGGP